MTLFWVFVDDESIIWSQMFVVTNEIKESRKH